MNILRNLPRQSLEIIIEAALAELDARDGDPDLEPEEDRGELDHLPEPRESIAGRTRRAGIARSQERSIAE